MVDTYLHAGDLDEVSVRILGDAKGVQHVSVELSGGVIGIPVAHKVVDEGVSSRLYKNTSERAVEEIWIFG